MRSLLQLEFRKQRNTFLGLLLIIGISLSLVTWSVATFAELSLGETFLSLTVMLQAFGIPFFALLLGSGAGASLRSTERKAEEDVPVRPIYRALAAYGVSLIYLIFLITILFAASTPLQYSSDVQVSFQIPLIMIVLLPLHSSAFVFSYWLAQGLLGSVISVIATAAPAYWLYINLNFFSTSLEPIRGFLFWILAIIFYPMWVIGGLDLVIFTVQATPEFAATLGHIAILVWLVNRVEREMKTRLPMKIGIAMLLLATLSLCIWGFFGTNIFMQDDQLRYVPFYDHGYE